MACERRWIVLGEDGRHVSVGRHSDPSDTELVTIVDTLRAQNTGAWLAVMEGDYYSGQSLPTLMMVRPLTPVTAAWDTAATAFFERRMQALHVA